MKKMNVLKTGLVSLLVLGFVALASNAFCEDNVAVKPTDKLAEKWWKDRYESQAKRMAEGNVDLLMVGDSITHGWEGSGREVWNKYYGQRKVMNFGISADRTEHVIWRLLNSPTDKISPKLIVLMIGTNNVGHKSSNPAQTVEGVQKIVSIMKEKWPKAKILLLDVFPRGETPADPLRVLVNEINAGLAKAFANVENVQWFPIGDRFLTSSKTLYRSIMPDLLHPNRAGYIIWAEAMEPIIAKTLGDKAIDADVPVACKEIPRINDGWMNRFKDKNELLKKGNIDILMIGDSITHGWEGSGQEVWNKYYGDKKAINLGISGDRTEHVIWRISNYDFSKVNPKLAVLLIGINNWNSSSADDIAQGNRKICQILHVKFPKMKIIVLNVFPYGKKSEVEKRSKVDAINKSLAAALADLDYVKRININNVFLNKDDELMPELMPDYLHPNAAGYEKWGSSLDAPIRQAL